MGAAGWTGVRVGAGSDVAEGIGAGAAGGEGAAGADGGGSDAGGGTDVEVGATVGDGTGVEVGAGVSDGAGVGGGEAVDAGAAVGVSGAGATVGEEAAIVSVRRATSGSGAASPEDWPEQATNSPATAIAAASLTARVPTLSHDSNVMQNLSQRSESPSILAKFGKAMSAY